MKKSEIYNITTGTNEHRDIYNMNFLQQIGKAAKVLDLKGDIAQAITILEEILQAPSIQENPVEHVEALTFLADIYGNIGEYEKALHTIAIVEAIDLHDVSPDLVDSHLQRLHVIKANIEASTSGANAIKRTEAISIIVTHQLKMLTSQERSEQLEIMCLEVWDTAEGWNLLPTDLQQEFEDQELRDPGNSARYDPVLAIWLSAGLKAVSNTYLRTKLLEIGMHVTAIEGSPVQLESCPCCGCRTLGSRGDYNICRVCWWEDDGQDNHNASAALGGPNYGISLTQARYNYLVYGIYDPSRQDLKQNQHQKDMYEIGREFEIVEDNIIIEKGTHWNAAIAT